MEAFQARMSVGSKIWPYVRQDCLTRVCEWVVSLKSQKCRCPPSKAVAPAGYVSRALGSPNGWQAWYVLRRGDAIIGLLDLIIAISLHPGPPFHQHPLCLFLHFFFKEFSISPMSHWQKMHTDWQL